MSYMHFAFDGNVGREPSVNNTSSGQSVASFTVAHSRRYTDRNGQPVNDTIWFNCSCWGKLAETASKYVHKGDHILLEGRLRPDPATGRPKVFSMNDGSFGSSYEVTVERIHLQPRSSQTGSSQQSENKSNFSAAPAPNYRPADDYNFGEDGAPDDIPF